MGQKGDTNDMPASGAVNGTLVLGMSDRGCQFLTNSPLSSSSLLYSIWTLWGVDN